MEIYDVMRTTFAARDFVDEPVSDATLHRILDNARFAPSGGNRQGWKVIAVRDKSTKDALFGLIKPTWQRYLAQVMNGEAPWNTINPTELTADQIAEQPVAADSLAGITHAPVVLFVLVDLSVVASFDSGLDRVGIISGGSVYPFAWNLLLAARNEGLGGTLTTFIAAEEPALQKLLGAPEHMAFAAMIPLGKPKKQLTKLKRKPVEDFAVLERWDGPPIKS